MTKEWPKYKDTILSLYKDQSKTLHEVRQIMRDDHGFEASVRAYRSRFDKWRVNKYNIARRRSAPATMAASYEPGHSVQSQIKAELHTGDMSPLSSTFRHGPVEQSYCSLAMPEDHNLKALVHRFARQDDGIGTIQEQQIYGGQFTCHSQADPSSYTDLELIIPTLQVPLQPGQLKTLLHCLQATSDIHRRLATTGYPPFPHLVNLFFEHLSSRGHTAGNEGGDDVLRALGDCFSHLIDRGADPNILVGGTPLLFRLLEAPKATGAYGPLWGCVQCLAKRALPVRSQQQQQQQQQQQDYHNGGGGGATKTLSNALHNRIHLTTNTLIPRLAELGRLDDRDARGLSAFQVYARDFAARDGMHHFLRVSAEFVRHGAGTGAAGPGVEGNAIVPLGFVEDVRAACRTGALGSRLQSYQGVGGGGGGGGGGTALWATVWISACQLSLLGGDEGAVGDHLSVLEYCTKGQANADACRLMLPGPSSSSSQSQSVDLASPATGSEGSEEGNYTW
ncbi:hypothetical protein VMCG_03152 [Cytospora schulzeri]|uniref:Clr5 domain-containing protein n=1 Tax=Cytospora schulzeri TaxID=448051 RepID=A0A423WXQ9_9PEZI|nr:hypothetical protein VMCG_03152 [Valsa malicola]